MGTIAKPILLDETGQTMVTKLQNIATAIGGGDSMQKVTNPVSNDILLTDASGQAIDSGHKLTEFATAAQGLLAESAVQDPDYNHTDNNYTTEEKTKLGTLYVPILDAVKVNGVIVTPDANKAANITISHNLSDYTNDAGFVADPSYVHTDANYTAAEKSKLAAIAANADVNVIESVKVNGAVITPDEQKAVDITVPTKTSDITNDSDFVEDADYVHTDSNYTAAEKSKLAGLENTVVTDNVTSTSATDALSAKQGKLLNDRINNLESMGRFLALWNCATGLPESEPTSYPYIYKAGDYFRISNVAASGANNYMPSGTQYTGEPSTVIFTGDIATSDIWFYDGTEWKLQYNRSTITDYVKDVKVNNISVVTSGIANVAMPTKTSDLTNDSDFVEDSNYVHTDSNYTASEKTKLAGIDAGADVNVIESVKVNGTALNPDSNKAVNVVVPTKTSDITNDSNYAADPSYVHTDNNYSTADKTKLAGLYQNWFGSQAQYDAIITPDPSTIYFIYEDE